MSKTLEWRSGNLADPLLPVSIGVLAHPLDRFSTLDCSITKSVPMPKKGVFGSRRELSLDVSVGVHILLVLEQSSLESQPRGWTKTPVLTVVMRRS